MLTLIRQSLFRQIKVRYVLAMKISQECGKKEKKPKIGFIGLGLMGKPMASHIVESNYQLTVFDVAEDRRKALEKLGAACAKNAKEVAEKSDIIITMLPGGDDVSKTFYRKDGLFEGAKKPKIFIDSSTVDPSLAVTLSLAATERGCTFLDAPVSGGTIGAESGTLTFLVGGDEEEFDQVKEILELMGKNVINCGKVGMGQAAKICNNMLLGITMVGASETMNLGRRLGLDAKLLMEVISVSSGRCWCIDTYNPVPGVIECIPPANKYKGGFQSQLMCKDLGLAQDISTRLRCPIPLGAAAHQFYRLVTLFGDGKKDFAYVYQYLKGKGSD